MKKYALVIHGGCGAVHKFTPDDQARFLQSLEKIVLAGEELLKSNASALDVVEFCVKRLEDDPIYNAGLGSVLNEDGEIEMDAAIMDGRNLKAGAIAGVFTAKNPIEVARRVMEKTQYVLLVGKGAERFLEKEKLDQKSRDYFITEHRVKQLAQAKENAVVAMDHQNTQIIEDDKQGKLGTVGAVAFDRDGNIAAATSTGGMTNKMVGRTGDSPLIGCGTFADNATCGVSCTGRGEDFIRTGLAKYLSDLIDMKGLTAREAALEAIEYFQAKVAGYGGFIMIDKNGVVAEAYSTEGLIRASVREGSKPVCKLFE